MSFQKKILIADRWGCDALMETPRLFVEAGCVVDVYASPRSWAVRGRYHNRLLPMPADDAEYLAGLVALASSNAYDWIVLGDDESVRLCSTLPAGPAREKLLPVRNPDARDMLGSKAGLSLACAHFNIPTPAFAVYDPKKELSGNISFTEYLSALAEKISFPLVLKIDQSSGGAGVFRVNSIEELRTALALRDASEKKDLVLQHYVHGKNVSVESIYSHGHLVSYAYSFVTKTISGEFGVSAERQYVACPDIEDRLIQIGRTFDVHGFCSMTFMRDAAEHWLIETDFRPQAWYRLGRLGGTDFSRGIREFFMTHPSLVHPEFPPDKTEAIVRHFPRDLLWHIQNKKYLGVWLWLRNADQRWRTIPWGDPKLLFSILWCGAHYYARRLVRLS